MSRRLRYAEPPPLAPGVYRRTLASVSTEVSASLLALGTSTSLPTLTGRVSAAEQATRASAARLAAVTPPPDVRVEHADLVRAVTRLTAALAEARDETETHEVCAAPAVVALLQPSLAATRAAADALTAKGAAHGYRADIALPPTPNAETRRLGDGAFVRQGRLTGRGELTVDNGRGQDAVVTLVSAGRPAFSVYLRSGAVRTVDGIPDGAYAVYLTGGVDWDRRLRTFTRACTFLRFDQPLRFTTSRTASRIRWSRWRMTLQPVLGGTARIRDVDPSRFPAP
ncbi:MAG: hypothetical protein ACM3ZF_03565 [Mycobacterium leprae]